MTMAQLVLKCKDVLHFIILNLGAELNRERFFHLFLNQLVEEQAIAAHSGVNASLCKKICFKDLNVYILKRSRRKKTSCGKTMVTVETFGYPSSPPLCCVLSPAQSHSMNS
jgi:hypothetical protein